MKARNTVRTWASLSRYLCAGYATVDQWKKGVALPKLVTLYRVIDIAGIPKNDLYENIAYITPWRKRNAIPFIHWLEFDEELAEWFGLLNGNGYIPSKFCKIGFSSKDPELFDFSCACYGIDSKSQSIFFFCLTGTNFSQVRCRRR